MSATTRPRPPAAAAAEERRRAMAILAEARLEELAAPLSAIDLAREATDLRRPEAGLVMLRGRIGGDGGAFNLGEASVARASVRLPTGEVGHAYLLGRDTGRARLAAIADALWQRAEPRAHLAAAILEPVAARLAASRGQRAAQVAATRVDFFTMVRGDG